MGQLRDFMTALTALEDQVDPNVRPYKIRPATLPDLPAIWNWLPEGDSELLDTLTQQDQLIIAARLGVVRRTDTDEEADELLGYADRFLEVVDPALRAGPLTGAVEQRRMGQRTVIDRFGEIDVVCFEFPIRVRLTRPL